jgi:hypothetical protein
MADIEQRCAECLRLEDTAYEPVFAGEGDATLTHPDWPGLAIALAPLWR